MVSKRTALLLVGDKCTGRDRHCCRLLLRADFFPSAQELHLHVERPWLVQGCHSRPDEWNSYSA